MAPRPDSIGQMRSDGARRQTRRRMRRRTALLLNTQQQAQIQRHTGKPVDRKTGEEQQDAMDKADIDELERLEDLKEREI